MEVRFVVLSSSGQDRVVPMRLPVIVGRGEEAKLRLQKDSVSRRHCEFFIKDDVVYVRDLGSTNGTLLEREQIPASVATAVPAGAVVNVGGVAFRVEYESAAAPAVKHPAEHDTLPLDVMPAADDAAPPAGEAGDAAGDEAGPATMFAGLSAEEPANEGVAWLPEGEAEPPPADDDNLNDFFKSLS